MTEITNRHWENPELEAELYYLTTDEGGRKTAVNSGYRGQFYYNGRDWDAPQEFVDKRTCNPGETVKVRLQTLSPDFHTGQFYIGQNIETREGAKTVARGKITKILRQDFAYWDYDLFFKQLPSDCTPYDKQEIEKFITDCSHILSNIQGVKELKFSKTLSDKYCMLTIECILKDKTMATRPLIDEICKVWRESLSCQTNLYKIRLEYIGKCKEFELSFATWHNVYLTGKIIISML